MCGVVVLLPGTLVAVTRTPKGPVYWPARALATAYTDFFRGLPLIIDPRQERTRRFLGRIVAAGRL